MIAGAISGVIVVLVICFLLLFIARKMKKEPPGTGFF